MSRTRTTGNPLYVTAHDNRGVAIQKVHTPRGERLRFEAPRLGETNHLDAVALESVTWQDADEMADRARSVDADESIGSDTDWNDGTSELMVANEYGQVVLEKEGDSGVHLTAPKLGYDITLGVDELEWLTVQDHETFTEFLEQPFGPGDEHDHH
ncbi:hypothetical protein [Natrialba swarupiae]|uniref:Uncharacterized protein n=1 Tax=Natrialba swarupiae TaxID=2448032 RepID=A0A5D5ANK6_9EURY|nr:hypothetical protein [Natrialba swarupiae]TYT62593.1 hypothetical protein FYC77_07445 [Natrialba swarupiae]